MTTPLKPCARCGHGKSVHASNKGFCRILRCRCLAFVARQAVATPSQISGKIRQQAERIVDRFNESFNPDALLGDYEDAQHILRLLDELDSALLTGQLEQSVKEKS